MKIKELISQLDNPREELQAEKELIALGEEAIKELREFISSPPRASTPAWIRAVDILVRIDPQAFNYLNELILKPWSTPEDSPERLAEEILKDHIASVLMDISPSSSRVRHTLLTALDRYRLLGAARVLARRRDPEAIPYLLEMLEDDTKSGGAKGALLHYGEKIIPHLIKNLNQARKKENGEETPGSILRRKKIIDILGLLSWEGSVNILKSYLNHPDLGVEAALALVHRGHIDEITLEKLIEGFQGEDWFTSFKCKEALTSILEKRDTFPEHLIERVKNLLSRE